VRYSLQNLHSYLEAKLAGFLNVLGCVFSNISIGCDSMGNSLIVRMLSAVGFALRLLTTSPILFSDCGSRRTLVWLAARASSASFRYGVFNNRSPNLQH
jgi:hypothetical protein